MEQQHTFLNNFFTSTDNIDHRGTRKQSWVDDKSHFYSCHLKSLTVFNLFHFTLSSHVAFDDGPHTFFSSSAHLAPQAETSALCSPQLASSPYRSSLPSSPLTAAFHVSCLSFILLSFMHMFTQSFNLSIFHFFFICLLPFPFLPLFN